MVFRVRGRRGRRGEEEREEEIGIGHLGKGGENPNKLWGQRIPVRDCVREREERGRRGREEQQKEGREGGAAEGGEALVTERKPT